MVARFNGLGVAAVLGLGGCAPQVISLYEQTRVEALAKPSPAPKDWKPDAVLDLAPTQLDALVAMGVQASGGLEKTYSGKLLLYPATVKTALLVDRVDLSPSTRCKTCFTVDLRLKGDVHWTWASREGTVPIGAGVAFDTEFLSALHDRQWDVTAKLHDVKSLDIHVKGVETTLRPLLETSLGGWLREELLADAREVQLGSFGSADVPLRGFRLAPLGEGVRLEMLSGAKRSSAVVAPDAPPESGFRVSMATDSVISLARAAAFEAGALSYGVVAEPTRLGFQGANFDLGMRLWRPVGRGWWRDYTVQGAAATSANGVSLTPRDVMEGERSKGAVFSDPLAALGEGVILKTIEQSVATTLPMPDGNSSAIPVSLRVHKVRGDATTLVVDGRLEPGAKVSTAPAAGQNQPRPR